MRVLLLVEVLTADNSYKAPRLPLELLPLDENRLSEIDPKMCRQTPRWLLKLGFRSTLRSRSDFLFTVVADSTCVSFVMLLPL